jgi:hypothetical protein
VAFNGVLSTGRSRDDARFRSLRVLFWTQLCSKKLKEADCHPRMASYCLKNRE